MSMYDVLIIGAVPGGIFTAYELLDHERFRWCRCFLGWKVQHHERFRRHALRV